MIPFKIAGDEFIFHSGSAVYCWNGSYVSNIPCFVRGYNNEHGKKGEPGRWYVYGTNYSRSCKETGWGERCPDIETILETEYQKQIKGV